MSVIGVWIYVPYRLFQYSHTALKAYLYDSLASMGFYTQAVIIVPDRRVGSIKASCRVIGSINRDLALRVAQDVCQAVVDMSGLAKATVSVIGSDNELISTWEI